MTFSLRGMQENDCMPSNNVETNQSQLEIQLYNTGMDFVASNNYNNGPCWYFVKRSFLNKTGLRFKDGYYCEDGTFTMTMFLTCGLVLKTNIETYLYIRHPASTTIRKDYNHLIKMLDSFEYAMFYLTRLIEKHQHLMPSACYERCIERRNSYTLFYLLRVLRGGMRYRLLKKKLNEFHEKGLYPFQRMKRDYPSRKLGLIQSIVNNRILFTTICKLRAITLRRPKQ